MSSPKHLRAHAALAHTVDALEGTSWSKSISERGLRLMVGLQSDSLSIHPCFTIPGPSAPPVRCRYSEEQRLQRVAIHMTCLRGDLLSIGLDFADPFPEAFRKTTNGAAVSIVEYEPSRTQPLEPSLLP